MLLSPSARRLAALLGRPEGIYERPRLPVPDDRPGWIEVSIRYSSIETAVHDLLVLGPGVDVLRARSSSVRHCIEQRVEIAAANAGAWARQAPMTVPSSSRRISLPAALRGQFVDEHDLARALVPREVVAGEVDEAVLVDVVPVTRARRTP